MASGASGRAARERAERPAPRLSVAMAVHNGLPFLEESVRSILAQTLADFEFVIGDDGSTDGSTALLRTLAAEDPRIRLLRRDRPSGLAGSANWVVGETQAPLVAIMHADDRSYPDRLARQVAAMDAEPDAQLVGVLYDGIDDQGRRVRPADWWRLSRRSPFAPFVHSSILFRRDAFDRVGGYRPEADYWEDLDLYFRIAALGRILVVPEVLASVRFAPTSARLTSRAERVDEAVDLMYRSVADYLAGGAYPRRFPGGGRLAPGAKLRPETWFGRGSSQVWAGKRPGLLLRMLRRTAFRADRVSAAVLAWAVLATVSPKSLRLLLRGVMRWRRRQIAPGVADRPWVAWDPADARAASASPADAGQD